MKADDSRFMALMRRLSPRLEGYLALIFGLLGLILTLLVALHWFLVLEPTLRAEAESRATVLAQSQIQGVERLIDGAQPPEQIRRELIAALGSILLFKDEKTGEPFIHRVSLLFDYDLLRVPPGSLDLDLGGAVCDGCFIARIPLYHPRDRLLIGVATCYSSPRFLRNLTGDLGTTLVWVAGFILLSIAYAWFQTRRFLRRLRESENNLRAVFEAAPFPMLLQADDEPGARRANQAARVYLDLREEASGMLDGETWRALLGAGLPDRAGEWRETQLKAAGEKARWALVSAVPMTFSGMASRLIGLADVSELKAVQEELRAASFTDALTGLYNRRYLYQRLAHEMDLANRYRHALSLILFDLDFFKRINDTFGHGVGDEVLVEVGRVLKTCTREVDVAGRHGGEEFLVILPHADLAEAGEVAERIRTSVAQIEFAAAGVEVTISGGVAQYQGEHLDAFVDIADRWLYMAKEAGRNRVLSAPAGVLGEGLGF
ncbi:GGDEF domain-containing protein [Allochromatium humboldtianum]|uniref:diguanylate cyclase n=2 Tax=Allochromatium humboldtianum TaxID=504901 RepID=A0A850RDT2_9GAMM|nr:GGDEF domain-containing protein [Allochromatium humboldtianum]